MAIFSASTVDKYNIGDDKLRSYLYKLNEDLNYMFNNLTPEDNYSKSALEVLAKEGEKVAELSVSVDGIFANYLRGDSLIASIALDDSGVTIKADKISLEGLVTANNNFKILLDGSIEAKNGKFSGHISGSTIESGSIEVGRFYADDEEVHMGCFYAYTSEETGADYLATEDQSVGIGDHPTYQIWSGGYNPTFYVDRGGSMRVGEIYVSDSWWEGWSLTRTLRDVYNRLENLEDAIDGL